MFFDMIFLILIKDLLLVSLISATRGRPHSVRVANRQPALRFPVTLDAERLAGVMERAQPARRSDKYRFTQFLDFL